MSASAKPKLFGEKDIMPLSPLQIPHCNEASALRRWELAV
jgi:hypothetical protein